MKTVKQVTTKATSINIDGFRNIPISTWEFGLRSAMLASRVPGGLEAGGRRSRTAWVQSVMFESVVRIVLVKEFGKNRENRHGIRVVEPFTLDSCRRFTTISGKGARRLTANVSTGSLPVFGDLRSSLLRCRHPSLDLGSGVLSSFLFDRVRSICCKSRLIC